MLELSESVSDVEVEVGDEVVELLDEMLFSGYLWRLMEKRTRMRKWRLGK